MSYSLEWKNQGVVARLTGRLDFRSIYDANNEIYLDKRCAGISFQIFDLRDVTEISIDNADIARLAAQDKIGMSSSGNVKLAFVAHDPEVKQAIREYTEISEALNSGWTSITLKNNTEAAFCTIQDFDDGKEPTNSSRSDQSVNTVCCGCKKIKLKDGSWDSVEEYLRKKTGRTVSHGYCDACFLSAMIYEGR